MGWKGAVRTMQADMRRAARNAERRHKQQAKDQALEDATSAVEAFEDYLKVITSIHSSSTSKTVNWQDIKNGQSPTKPILSYSQQTAAQNRFETYKPNLVDKIFKREVKKQNRLKSLIESATASDQQVYQVAVKEYEQKLDEWTITQKLATKVLAADPSSYAEVIKKYNPFESVEKLGSGIGFSINTEGHVTANVSIHSDEVVPKEKYSLRQSGLLSTKDMPKGEFFSIYQDYVCSCALRVGVELFKIIPLEKVVVNSKDMMLNPQTGFVEEQTILSVLIVKENFGKVESCGN